MKSTWVAKDRNELMNVIGSCTVQNGFTFGGAGAKMVPSPLLPDVHAFMSSLWPGRGTTGLTNRILRKGWLAPSQVKPCKYGVPPVPCPSCPFFISLILGEASVYSWAQPNKPKDGFSKSQQLALLLDSRGLLTMWMNCNLTGHRLLSTVSPKAREVLIFTSP